MVKKKTKKKPWPTKKAMKQIYEMNLWGGNPSVFYSGDGSHQPEIIIPYVQAVVSFLTSFTTPLVVCDLGCGDFNIGNKLVNYTKKYIAVDIVNDLIEYNKTKYHQDHLEFYCLDIATDSIPKGDCAIIRQVLQHLSNAEVSNIIRQLEDFAYIIVTEHIPNGQFIPNLDIISGQGIRLKKQSGIDITASPFSFKAKEEEQLSLYELPNNKGLIITTLYKVF